MKYRLDFNFLTSTIIVTVKMIDKKMINGQQCYNKVERYGFNNHRISKSANQFSSPIVSNFSRKKNDSFSCIYTPDKNPSTHINYYSDTSTSYIQTAGRKHKARRSLSSSPTFHSHYAGAKFSEPPSPAVLPLPPTHWTVAVSADPTPRSVTPVDFEISDVSCSSTPLIKMVASAASMNQSVELFFKKCSFNQIETCKDFTQSLKTLLNVPA